VAVFSGSRPATGYPSWRREPNSELVAAKSGCYARGKGSVAEREVADGVLRRLRSSRSPAAEQIVALSPIERRLRVSS